MENKPIKVLLVEDNPGDARLMQETLSEAKSTQFNLERVERLAPGLERLAQGGIDLVLLDLSLPDSRGLDTFTKVHENAPQVPILVLSGLDDETLAMQTVQEGAQDYLVKGHVDSYSLVRAMRYAIERKRAQTQLACYTEELRQRNEQMEADLTVACEVQQALLPPQALGFPTGGAAGETALRFFHRYRPTTKLGGDFFDVLPLSDTHVGLFLCDVMGHGVRAGLVTAMVRALVERPERMAADAGLFLAEVNRGLLRTLRKADVPTFATAFFLVADIVTGQIRYANAGHPSPFRLRRSAGVVEPLEFPSGTRGPALGIHEEAVYPTLEGSLATRDLLLLFTDGLFEVEGPNKEYYGQERLLDAARKRITVPPLKLFEELIEETQRFSVNEDFADDVCLVAMEVLRLGRPKKEKDGQQ